MTGRKLAVVFDAGRASARRAEDDEHAATEEEIFELLKSTFDARELDE